MRIAQGDLRRRAIPKTTDEIGVMLSSMGTMQDSLRELVSQVQLGIDQVGTASSELAMANGELSERNERQAAALALSQCFHFCGWPSPASRRARERSLAPSRES